VIANVTRYVDYEALYNEAQKSLDAKDLQIQVVQLEKDELRILVEKRNEELENLREELKMVTTIYIYYTNT
jgi:hypothetical protein